MCAHTFLSFQQLQRHCVKIKSQLKSTGLTGFARITAGFSICRNYLMFNYLIVQITCRLRADLTIC